MWRSKIFIIRWRERIKRKDAKAQRSQRKENVKTNIFCQKVNEAYQWFSARITKGTQISPLCVFAPLRLKQQHGFTLLEMVAVIILIAILGLFALDRLWSLRIAAERAMIEQVSGNIRSALGMEVARYAVENRLAELARLDGSNPMLLLAQTPTGYVGERAAAESKNIEAGSWFFDPVSKMLNYRIAFAENYDPPFEGSALVRFRITLVYRDQNGNQQFDAGMDAIGGLDFVREPLRSDN